MTDQPLPLVSVMISTRNRLALLQQSLRSVYAQDYPKLEILIVDDASYDGTSRYLRSHHPDIRWFRFEQNRGYVVARNLMMKEATGECVVSLDDDAYFKNTDAISQTVRRMWRESEIAVITFRVLPQERKNHKGGEVELYTSLFQGGAHCLRKTVLSEVGSYREFIFHQGEESDLALRLLNKGYRILYFPRAIIVHERSLVARDICRVAIYGSRNVLLRSWINEPFPWWVLSTGNALAKYLAKGIWDGSLPYVLKGFWAAMKELPHVKAERNPVSGKAMCLFLALRHSMIAGSSDVQKLYDKPPGNLRSLYTEARWNIRVLLASLKRKGVT